MSDDEDETFVPTSRGPGNWSPYDPKCLELAKGMCKLGATDFELAQALGVTSRAIQMWRLRYPEFEKATRVGKQEADMRVERSLFQRATGYTYESEKIVTVSIGDGVSEVQRIPIVEHVPPSESAAMKWLGNRQRKRWMEKQQVENTGVVTVKVEGGLPDEAPVSGELPQEGKNAVLGSKLT